MPGVFREKKLRPYILIFLLILTDQISKLIADKSGFFHIQVNNGLMLGLTIGEPSINLLLTLYLLIMFALYFIKHYGSWWFQLVIAGAMSNIIDRLLLGGVRDFITFPRVSYFNLADVFVVVGCLVLGLKEFTKGKVP